MWGLGSKGLGVAGGSGAWGDLRSWSVAGYLGKLGLG